jgi:hypothetical protein
MKAVPAFIPPSQFELLPHHDTFAGFFNQKPAVPPPRGIFA